MGVYTSTVQPDGESLLKKIGTAAVVPIVIVSFLLLIALLLRGMVWASDKVLPWLDSASRIAFGICLLVLLPLCLFRKTRPWAGVGFYGSSYLFGIMLFAYSCLFVVDVWGYTGLAVGLIFAGVGVVPVAVLAAVLHAEWAVLLWLLFTIVLTFGTRFLGIRLATAHPKEAELLAD